MEKPYKGCPKCTWTTFSLEEEVCPECGGMLELSHQEADEVVTEDLSDARLIFLWSKPGRKHCNRIWIGRDKVTKRCRRRAVQGEEMCLIHLFCQYYRKKWREIWDYHFSIENYRALPFCRCRRWKRRGVELCTHCRSEREKNADNWYNKI